VGAELPPLVAGNNFSLAFWRFGLNNIVVLKKSFLRAGFKKPRPLNKKDNKPREKPNVF